jgi:hypothetical protein
MKVDVAPGNTVYWHVLLRSVGTGLEDLMSL